MIRKTNHSLLDAPCIFCGYNGPGYWQAGTHSLECPWHGIGGFDERKSMLRPVIRLLFSQVSHSDKSWVAREAERLYIAYSD